MPKTRVHNEHTQPSPRKAPRKKASAQPGPKPGPKPESVRSSKKSHNAYHRENQERLRAEQRNLSIPEPTDWKLRQKCLEDVYTFMETCFPEMFYQAWTEQRRAMVKAIIEVARYKGDQSIAAQRGDGKSTLAFIVVLWLMLRGEVVFPVIIGKNQTAARDELEMKFKDKLATSEPFRDLFPELYYPIADVHSAPSRAKKQSAGGVLTGISWKASQAIRLPTIKDPWGKAAYDVNANGDPVLVKDDDGNPVFETEPFAGAGTNAYRGCALGQCMDAVGWEGRIRGKNFAAVRPDFALLDDLDDEESAWSEHLTDKRIQVIEKAVKGMAGPGKNLGRLMLCTIVSPICVAAIYTDPKQRPSWRGIRFKQVIRWPDDKGMKKCHEYIRLVQETDHAQDPDLRKAQAFYEKHKKTILKGVELGNPYRYDDGPGLDGEPKELDAFQSALLWIANGGDQGWENYKNEYQNEPSEGQQSEEDDITSLMVAKKLSGLPRYVCSRHTKKITFFVDINIKSRVGMHWAVCAWMANGHGQVIDYGVKRVSKAGIDEDNEAIVAALTELKDEMAKKPYATEDGEAKKIDLHLVDCGHWNQAVYRFVESAGARWRPAMGLSRYSPKTKRTDDVVPPKYAGDRYWQSRQQGLWVVNHDPPAWRRRVHSALKTQTFITDQDNGTRVLRPGALSLYGEEASHYELHLDKESGNFAVQIVAQKWRKEPFREGKQTKQAADGGYWWVYSEDDHYLDDLIGCMVAAAVCGIRFVNVATKPDALSKQIEAMAKASRQAGMDPGSAASKRLTNLPLAGTAPARRNKHPFAMSGARMGTHGGYRPGNFSVRGGKKF